MEDRELFRVLKEENIEEKDRLWYNPIKHTQLHHYKQTQARMGGGGGEDKPSIN
jgi:hypothetical protein